MVEQYLVWVLLVGIAIGAAATWFLIGRLPRQSDDLSAPELVAEADWISHSIERRGGVASPSLVEEVLDLHLEYLRGEPLPLEPGDPPADVGEAEIAAAEVLSAEVPAAEVPATGVVEPEAPRTRRPARERRRPRPPER